MTSECNETEDVRYEWVRTKCDNCGETFNCLIAKDDSKMSKPFRICLGCLSKRTFKYE